MKTVGIIGGVGPESTIEYYRLIIAAYRERQTGTGVPPDDHAHDAPATQTDRGYPSIIINSVDVNRLLAWMKVGDLASVTDYLVTELERLARAGVDFGVIAANTPHIVFDELQKRSPIPLLSIVEATRDEARSRGLKRVGLFGTRFTMQAEFYPEVFSRAGIQIIVPNDEEQSYIHEKYLRELLKDIFSPETREGLLAIVDRMKERDEIVGLILGGTELPLILRDAERNGVPFLDTTKIHVARIVAELLS
jgi:aspartate racemase